MFTIFIQLVYACLCGSMTKQGGWLVTPSTPPGSAPVTSVCKTTLPPTQTNIVAAKNYFKTFTFENPLQN